MKIIRWFLNSKLSIKIILYYLTIFILLAMLATFAFVRLNYGMTTQKVNQMSAETVNSINSNLDLMIHTVNSQSKMLLSSETLQSTLNGGGKNYNSRNQKLLDDYLAEFTNFNDAISSIYIFDSAGHEYFVDNVNPKNISLKKIEQSKCYPLLTGKSSSYILKLNAGGTFSPGPDGKNFISLIRVIDDINTQKPVGIMVMNLSEDYIRSSFESVTRSTGTRIQLNDENNIPVIHGDAISVDGMDAILEDVSGTGSSQVRQIDGTQYIISHLKNQYGWVLATITPINEFARQAQTYNIFLIVIVFINLVLLILALLFTSIFVTEPIKKLAGAMESVRNGSFNEVEFHTGADELGMLKDGYNLMVREIRKLFESVVAEQREKRKAELEMLQAQIKPHFLYNSFDAISSLALSGNNRDVYTLVKALGKFYRSFLNTGSEVITIAEELEIIRQYLTIQQFRFKDKFTVEWAVDDRANSCKIPRLTLQPLVENAIKHGITSMPGCGVLKISALCGKTAVELSVEDDGVGMDERELDRLMNGESSGAGLKITRERLRFYFNTASALEIDSEKGRGTVAKIIIPIATEEKNLQNET
jgi:Predicted signal transduction protein with a C-terminal ATPase domain